MVQKDIEELAETIASLPNYTEDYHTIKYLIIENVSLWLEKRQSSEIDVSKFAQLCWIR